MGKFLAYFQIVIAILLMVSILLQNRGSGLSAAFGGDFGGFYTKRGIEKFLFIASSVLGGLFLLTSAALLVINP